MIIVYILIFSMALVADPHFGRQVGPFTVEKWIGFGAIFYAIWYFPTRKGMPRFFRTFQAKMFIAFVILVLSSYLVTAKDLAFQGLISILISQFFFFFVSQITIDSQKRLYYCCLAYIGAIGFGAAYLLREWAGNIGSYGIDYRAGYVVGDPNFFTAGALVVLPLNLYFIINLKRRLPRYFCIGCLLLTIGAILIGQSRGGLLGMIAVLVLQARDSTHRKAFIGLSSVIVLAVLISPASPLTRLLHPTYSDKDSSESRLEMWRVAGRVIEQYPVLGAGIGRFHHYLELYAPGQDLNFYVPHNTYIQIAVELGFVGLGLFLLMLFGTFRGLKKVRRFARKAGDPFVYAVAAALSNGIVGFLVCIMFISALHSKVFWFAIFLSTCIPGLIRKPKPVDDEPEGDREPSLAERELDLPEYVPSLDAVTVER